MNWQPPPLNSGYYAPPYIQQQLSYPYIPPTPQYPAPPLQAYAHPREYNQNNAPPNSRQQPQQPQQPPKQAPSKYSARFFRDPQNDHPPSGQSSSRKPPSASIPRDSTGQYRRQQQIPTIPKGRESYGSPRRAPSAGAPPRMPFSETQTKPKTKPYIPRQASPRGRSSDSSREYYSSCREQTPGPSPERGRTGRSRPAQPAPKTIEEFQVELHRAGSRLTDIKIKVLGAKGPEHFDDACDAINRLTSSIEQDTSILEAIDSQGEEAFRASTGTHQEMYRWRKKEVEQAKKKRAKHTAWLKAARRRLAEHPDWQPACSAYEAAERSLRSARKGKSRSR